jgi:hypothetical protein
MIADMVIAETSKEIEHFCDLGSRVISQSRRRVLNGEQPTAEKIYSIFEPHTDLIKRGKVQAPIEFGHKVFLAESARGLMRALMRRPRLLMLDEPSLGLAPLIARQIFDAIRTLNRRDGLTVLIAEQNANHALRLAHHGYVMVNGLITLSGTGSELLQRPEIRAAYLEGRKAHLAPGSVEQHDRTTLRAARRTLRRARDTASCRWMLRPNGSARKLPMTSG